MAGTRAWLVMIALFGSACSKKTVVLKEPKPLKIAAHAPEKKEDPPPEPPPKRIEVKEDRVEVNETILFEYSGWGVVDESKGILDELAKTLNAHTEIKRLRIEGHTDTQGGAPQNLKLSKKRANSVMKYLVKQGVDAKRLSAEGYGQTKPIADNDSEEGRAKNRRVAFTILEKSKDKGEKVEKPDKDEDSDDKKEMKKDSKKDAKKDSKKDVKKDTKKDDDADQSDDEEKP
jgi:outer membrane protein OmpA-like peptidoglycan-associated protein